MKSTPKVLWQTWKDKNVPLKFREYVIEWKRLHQTYEYFLIDDEDLLKIVEDTVPGYSEKYKNFTKNIERVDFARYALLYNRGGVYADLDTLPLKNIDIWVNKNKVILGCEPQEHAQKLYNRERVVCNALMISPPKEKFWLDLMKYIIDNYEKNYRPVENTGPLAITNFLESDQGKKYNKEIIITEPCVFYPQLSDGKISKKCNIEKSYVKHIWENTWVVPWYKDSMWFNARYWFYISLFIFVILWIICYRNK